MTKHDLRVVDENFKALESAGPPFDGPPNGGDNSGMEARLTALETRFDAVLPTLATRADVADVRVDIQRGINETHKWMIATVIGLFLGFGGLFLAMSNALKPVANSASASQPPIIINVPAPAPSKAPAAKP